jgi:long-chain acyl-CoA synthetase
MSLPSPLTARPRFDFRACETELVVRAKSWTQSAVFARENPSGLAVASPYGERSFAQLHDNANRLGNAMLALGLKAGDGVALMCRNRPEFVEVFLACMRTGMRLTPINAHLTAPEVAYIVGNSEARLFIVEQALLAQPRDVSTPLLLAVVEIDGRDDKDYARLLAQSHASETPAAPPGRLMLYTSGTTGQPKGVISDNPEMTPPQYAGSFANFNPSTDANLCCGPAYHSGPLLFDVRWPLASGVPIVFLDKWDSSLALRAIAEHRVTHAHMVPTMFQRLLQLPLEARALHDVSSLRVLIHGAAPCSVQTKRAMIDWLGPVLFEYYGATEGGNGINVSSADWLRKPGTVGKLSPDLGHRVLREDGQPAAIDEVGKIYFKAPGARFSYFNDPEKTANAYQGDMFTLGDLGYVDADGYLFLTGRVAECIITGGVNVYPQEVDDALARHPLVQDVCTVGAPDPEWGERVVSLVVLREGATAPDMTAELLDFAATQLASFKRPKSIIFETQLPRTASGKLLRQSIRARFWPSSARSI